MTIMRALPQIRGRLGTGQAERSGQPPTGRGGPAVPRRTAFWLVALVLTVTALAESAMALFLAGTVAGGVASGAIFLGSLAMANRLAPAGRRGQSLSAFFVACYAGLIIPVVGVGVLSGLAGTFSAVLTFSILLAALSLFSISRFASVGGDR